MTSIDNMTLIPKDNFAYKNAAFTKDGDNLIVLSINNKNSEWVIEIIGSNSKMIYSNEFKLNSHKINLFLIDNGFGVIVTDLHDLNKKTLLIWESIEHKCKMYELKNPPADYRHVHDLYFDQENKRFIATMAKSTYAEHAHYWSVINEKMNFFSKEYSWNDNYLYHFLEPDKLPIEKVKEHVRFSFNAQYLQQYSKSPVRIIDSEFPAQLFVDHVCIDRKGMVYFSSPGSSWLQIKSYNRLYDWNAICVYNSKFQFQYTQEMPIGKTIFSSSSELLMVIPYPKADSLQIYTLSNLMEPKILKPIKKFIPIETPPKTLSIFDIINHTLVIGNWKSLQVSKIDA